MLTQAVQRGDKLALPCASACVGGGVWGGGVLSLFPSPLPPQCRAQELAPVLWENSGQTCGDEQGIDVNNGVDRAVEQLHFQLLTSDLTINMSLAQAI